MSGHDTAPTTGAPGPAFWLLVALIAAGAAYAVGVDRLRARGDRWPIRRSVSITAGLLFLAVAVLPLPGSLAPFPEHVVQHLLMAMLAPLLLALGAPVTLLLRTSRGRVRSTALRVLHSRWSRAIMLGPVIVVLEIGGLYGYYLTPLYELAHHDTAVKAVVHLHMFLAGCLLSWYLVGLDPMKRRPGVRMSLTVLLLVAAAHDLLAKLMFAHRLPAGGGSDAEIELGSQLMYYGGTVVELAVAITVLTRWYGRTGRAYRRDQLRGHQGTSEATAGRRPEVPATATPTMRG